MCRETERTMLLMKNITDSKEAEIFAILMLVIDFQVTLNHYFLLVGL